MNIMNIIVFLDKQINHKLALGMKESTYISYRDQN